MYIFASTPQSSIMFKSLMKSNLITEGIVQRFGVAQGPLRQACEAFLQRFLHTCLKLLHGSVDRLAQ